MTAPLPVTQATLDATVLAVMDALCAVQWPALPGDAGPLVRVDHIARVAVTAALPVLAAAIGEQIAVAIESQGRPVEHEAHDPHCVPCVVRRLTNQDDAAIARAGTSGGES